jgi:hypothetical protein
MTNAIDTRTMSNALSHNLTHSSGPQIYAVGFNTPAQKAAILSGAFLC